MALIEFKNKPNTDTPINDDNLNHNFKELNNKIKKHIVSSQIDRTTINMANAWDGITFPLSKNIITGDKLSVNNNKIIVGKGVSKVVASFSMTMFTSPDWTDGGINISVNNQQGVGISQSKTNIETGITITNTIIEVKENDEISFGFNCQSAGNFTILCGFAYVEVIE